MFKGTVYKAGLTAEEVQDIDERFPNLAHSIETYAYWQKHATGCEDTDELAEHLKLKLYEGLIKDIKQYNFD
jgi:hypothetical protein